MNAKKLVKTDVQLEGPGRMMILKESAFYTRLMHVVVNLTSKKKVKIGFLDTFVISAGVQEKSVHVIW